VENPMAEDAAEPGSRKDPQRSKSRSASNALTGFSFLLLQE
jgi:hypothetical protein